MTPTWLAVAALLLSSSMPEVAAAQRGITLASYDNSVLHGTPRSAAIVPTLAPLRVDMSTRSAEALGMLTYPSAGAWAFECTFGGSIRAAFVWLDDHQVCVFGAYDNQAQDRSSIDGSPGYPLIAKSANTSSVLRIQFWGGSSTAASASSSSNSSAGDEDMTVAVQWRQCAPAAALASSPSSSYFNCSGAPLTNIPAEALTPSLPPNEIRRRALQRQMLSEAGWGAWAPHNYLSLVSLPSAARVSLMFCRISSKTCLTSSIGPDCHDRYGGGSMGLSTNRESPPPPHAPLTPLSLHTPPPCTSTPQYGASRSPRS